MRYGGVCDAHGIDSFFPLVSYEALVDEDAQKVLNGRMNSAALRAKFNRQRAAMIYVVDLTSDEVAHVEKMLDNKRYSDALNWLKKQHTFVVESGGRKHLKLIPNSDLDFGW